MRLEIIDDNPDRVPICRAWSAEPTDECEPTCEPIGLRHWLIARRTARKLIGYYPTREAEFRKDIALYTDLARQALQRLRNGRIRHVSSGKVVPK